MSDKTEQKKVTVSDRRALEKLLEEEYALIRLDLDAMADEAKRQRTRDVEASHAKHIATGRRFEDRIKRAIREAEDAGFRVKDGNGYRSRDIRFNVENLSLATAVEKAKQEIDGDLDRAKMILRKKEHEAKRQLLASTLSDEAVTVMETMPQARQIMAEAIAVRQIEMGGASV